MNKFIIALLILLTSCVTDGQQEFRSSNQEITLSLLFEHDGCKVYRFKDGGSFVYWSDCRGRISHEVTHHNGKVTYTEHELTIND